MLLIDIGHTRLKSAQYISTGKIKSVISFPVQDVMKILPEEDAIVSCVDNRVKEKLKSQKHLRFVSSTDVPFPSRYNLSLLGADRLLACMASVEVLGFRDAYVLDAGSFVTVDLIREGVHHGGAIFPGIGELFGLAKAVLGRELYYEPVKEIDSALSTDRAVNFALGQMFGFLKGDNLPVVLTGGDANLLEGILLYFGKEYIIEPDLVLLGLSCMVDSMN